MRALEGVERLVLLGDLLELRHGPEREALAVAEPVLAALGAALGPRGEIVIVPGNHDHAVVAPWLDRRARTDAPPPLGLEQEIDHRPGEPLARLADAAAPARVRGAYPGLWLREDVYATHGHYLDLHTTVPTFERLALGVLSRIVGALPTPATPADYEARQAPLYAALASLAASRPAAGGAGGAGASARIWHALAGRRRSGRTARLLALRAAAALILRLANRLGLGPLQSDVAHLDVRAAALTAFARTLELLDVRAAHVLFGHTHRAGPWPADDPGEWRTAAGTCLWNCGSWVYERGHLTSRPGESPYWPGAALELGATGPPRLRSLLGYRTHSDLAPPQEYPSDAPLTRAPA